MSLISDERIEELLANEKEKDAQIERHKDLHARAADALAGMDPKWEGDWSALIAELRKAAE